MNQSIPGVAQPLPSERKSELVERIRRRAENENDLLADSAGACVLLAHHTMEVLIEEGFRPLIQAGTMCWPRVTEEQDDGVSSTHFSYVWEPDHLQSQAQIAAGRLPEMHVWVGLIETGEVVDLTTRDFPRAHRNLLAEPWLGPLPPDYLWCRQLPEWVVYTPNAQATAYAMGRLWEIYRPRYLQHIPQLQKLVTRVGAKPTEKSDIEVFSVSRNQ